jgi:dienelactone hydrolase
MNWLTNLGAMWRSGLSLAIGVTAAGICWAQPSGTPPSVQSFFSPAKLQDAELSPSGRWLIALTAGSGQRVGLQVVDLEGKDPPSFIAAPPNEDVAWFEWVSDDWLVFGVRSPNDRSGRRLDSGLIALKRDGSSTRMIITRDYQVEDLRQRKRFLNPNHFYLARGARGKNEIIVGELRRDVAGEFSHVLLKIVDVTTGTTRTMLSDAPRADSWMFDAQGRARIATFTKEGTTTWWWAGLDGKWAEISKSPTYEQPFTPSHVDGQGFMELRRFDFTSGKPEPTPILQTPGFDAGVGVMRETESGKVVGLLVHTDATTQIWLDPVMKAMQEKVDAKFPSSLNFIACRRCDGTKPVLVFTRTDRDPGNYVLWRPKENSWSLVGEVKPEIQPERMSPLEFHRTKARDGRDLPVWVTRPASTSGPTSKAAPLPAVVLVHGGPFIRAGDWRWHAESQFLASRGYVVIEPEFRGSVGYGDEHFRAGWKQWGSGMQNDVADSLAFAVKSGWVDPKRVCIMGWSFGGYATLMGMVREPSLYQCGIAGAAPSDLRFIYDFHWSDESDEGRRYHLPSMMGDLTKDAALLASASAVDQAHKITKPLLLVHGARDKRVPIEHGDAMLTALRKAGKQVEWVRYADEGHSFIYDENKFDFYSRVEKFLAQHLKH